MKCKLHRAAFALSVFVAASASAQQYPTKPVRMIVPFAPGGNTDIIARAFTPKWGEVLGQQVIVDNRGGAGGSIGTEVAARAAPDGYTLLMVSAGHTINPAMIKKLPYDSVKDFTPLGIIADVPTALVIHPSIPAKNMKELIAVARSTPDGLNYSTAGRGTVGHLAAELLVSLTKMKLTPIHYKSAGLALTDVVSGQIHFQFSSMPAALQHTRSGRLRMIAQTGETRSAAAKDVPTAVEQGVKGFVVASGFALFGPANMPRPLVERVNGTLVKALQDPGVKNNLGNQGADVVASTPEAHDKFNRNEIAKWIKVARNAHIEAE
ncbi:MAG TPA: tripartite tricarboxylate transporter substrate binding protein [Burkholderiales bacterium]|nr:tripartite tricarboxylate transporter substrate binding protein [Burkholderiales bacterium]